MEKNHDFIGGNSTNFSPNFSDVNIYLDLEFYDFNFQFELRLRSFISMFTLKINISDHFLNFIVVKTCI